MIHEERLINIELKLTHQEDLVETLNQIVYQQQIKIAHLEKAISQLAQQLKETASNLNTHHPGSLDNERPPHY